MRNLKKILALVLALVMSMSLLATANAFNDDAEIDPTYDEAVTVLANLKVFKGYNNGETFVPKGSITRAEVAAILYRIATGDVTDSQVGIYADYNKFSDVKSTSWYAGYVNYCANAEYIKGYDDKTFGPNDPVTGYQALAMILRAVGYDANGEFTGNGWQVNVASYANQLGLTRNVTAGTLATAATREVVAEILFRTIAEAYVVKYTAALGYQPVYLATSSNKPGSLVLFDGVNFGATLGGQTFGLARTEGEITAVGRTAGTTTFGNWNATGTTFTANTAVVTNTNTPWTDIGYAAYVYTVPTVGAKTRTAVSDVVVTGESVAVNTAETTNHTISGLVSAGSARVATLDTNYNVYYNGNLIPKAPNGSGSQYPNQYWFDTTNMVVKYGAGNGTNTVEVVNGLKVDFIDNDDGGLVEAIVFTEYTVAQVAGIANENNTGTNAIVRDTYYFTDLSKGAVTTTSAKTANVVSADTLAVNDLVTYVAYAGDLYVTKAPVTTGTFTQINYSAITRTEESFVIGGNPYEVANEDNSAYWQNYCYAGHAALNRTNVGKDMAVYTDPHGYIIYVTENVAPTNYLYVVRTNHSDNVAGTTYATVAFGDGSVQNVYLTRDNANFFQTIASDMYAYTVNAAGNYVLGNSCDTLTTDSMAHAAGIAYTNGSATLVAGDAYITNSTVVVDLRDVIAKRATTATVYTGYSEIPSVTGATFHYVTDSRNFVTLAFLTAGTNTANLAKSFVVFHTNAHYYGIDADNNKFYNLTVISGGELKTVTLTETQYTDVCALGVGMYSYANDGVTLTYTSFNEVWENVTWQDGAIVVNGYGYPYTSDVNFFTLDIANGNAYDYVMNFGMDTTSAKAVVVRNSKGVATDIYVVYGKEADVASSTTTTADDGVLAKYSLAADGTRTQGTDITYTMRNQANNGTNVYYAKPGYVTNYTTTYDASYDITVNDAIWKENVLAGTKVTLPATENNPATEQEYVKVEAAGKAAEYLKAGDSYIVTADTKITTDYYQYTINGKPYYVKGVATQVYTADVNAAIADETGMYYLWNYAAAGSTATKAFFANNDPGAFVIPATYTAKEITTGFWKVTTGDSGKTTADKVVYTAAGVEVPAGTALTADTAYYATVDTTFTWERDNAANTYHTVKLDNVADFDFQP